MPKFTTQVTISQSFCNCPEYETRIAIIQLKKQENTTMQYNAARPIRRKLDWQSAKFRFVNGYAFVPEYNIAVW